MNDAQGMAHALSLGRRGLGSVWPNPAVGCVIVAGGRVVGRGWTQVGGRPHAEAMALAMAGDAARGATAYVTLEPCAHHGRTPPCAEALLAAGVARVVSAMEDPDPRVSGRGHAILRAGGVSVETGVGAGVARDDQAGFLMRVTAGRPLVTLKLAASLDGRIATASGESRWITGSAARTRVHAMRLEHDAILVGGGTARADDPELTVRGLGEVHQPVRIVAARKLDLPTNGRLTSSVAAGPFWLLHGREAAPERVAAWAERGARPMEVSVRHGRIDPWAIMARLGAEGLTRVFCEGGGSFAAALLEAGLVDRLVVFSAGLALGAEGRPALGALGIGHLAAAPRFELIESEPVGGDVMHLWRKH